MFNHTFLPAVLGAGFAALALSAGPVAAAEGGEALIRKNCTSCHTEERPGAFSRIEGQRKTPEGWQMSINRMEHHNGLRIPAADKRTIIQYLADTRGLAPAEAAPWRYLLEQDTNRVEAVADEFSQMCARCHSGARFGLQRRSVDEWRLLVHTHIAQTPTLELQAMSRDRPWLKLALEETAPQLAAAFPLESDAWRDWQKAAKPELAGQWRLVGFVPGKGAFDARMTATGSNAEGYALKLEGRYLDGRPLAGSGTARVFTGYEWRGTLVVDGVAMRQVLAADADGARMSGRQFAKDAREMGGALTAVREDGASRVVAMLPQRLRAGETGTLTIIGSGLSGKVSLGAGVKVVEVVSRDADRVVVRARAQGEGGLRDVTVGKARAPGMLAVYERIARVEVQPADAVARIGGPAEAQMEKVRVAYRAMAYAETPAGELPLGEVPVAWSIAPADETAEHEQDHVYAGAIDATGVFTPGDAGPNPARIKSGSNVGRLQVVASALDGGTAVEGRGKLLVAPPDFVRRVLD